MQAEQSILDGIQKSWNKVDILPYQVNVFVVLC